jgi:hypothetical protein
MLELFDGILDTCFFGPETLYFPLRLRRNVYALLCHSRSSEQMYYYPLANHPCTRNTLNSPHMFVLKTRRLNNIPGKCMYLCMWPHTYACSFNNPLHPPNWTLVYPDQWNNDDPCFRQGKPLLFQQFVPFSDVLCMGFEMDAKVLCITTSPNQSTHEVPPQSAFE